MMRSRYFKGREGESAAAEYLSQSGVKILERNFRCPAGEIDIVARDGRTIVFVEVRSRQADGLFSPEETINRAKQRRVIRAAQWYIKGHRLENSPARFDVVAIRWYGETPDLNWIVNAFETRS